MERIRVEVKDLELMGRITEKVLENFIGDPDIEIAGNQHIIDEEEYVEIPDDVKEQLVYEYRMEV